MVIVTEYLTAVHLELREVVMMADKKGPHGAETKVVKMVELTGFYLAQSWVEMTVEKSVD